MPISRFHIRSEHSLADPELHRAADRDDPEALLEAVAMAGLVGVLRQLGDLAQFAAEIFHDLHEEVLATATRGHSLISRVQQLEAEVPALEKAFLSQTHHSLYFTNGGIDWHPNRRSEQNLVTRGDMPRFIMESYEECRGPPRLFLLDKFDVAGAGACLKRYTDPSFFKVESASSVTTTAEVHREKRIRKVKQKKVAQPRNGETPEVVSSHAKLHQLFLEECIENASTDPACLVKLKKKQLNGSSVESKTGKSYMEKILELSSPGHKRGCETSITPLPVKLMSDDTSENGIKILGISSVSPVKRSSRNESTCSSPNEQELELKPYSEMDRETNGGLVQGREEVSVGVTDEMFSNHPKVPNETELVVDEQKKRECGLDGYHSDDVTSEVDDYMDALATIEELETDIECRPRKSLLNIQKVDSNGKEEHQLQAQFSDSESFGDSLTSEEINSFNQYRNEERTDMQARFSDSQATQSSSASDDNRSSKRDRIEEYTQLQAQFPDSQSIVNSSTTSEIENMPSNQLPQTAELHMTYFGEFIMHDDARVHGEEVSDSRPGEEVSDSRPVSSGPVLMDSGHLLLSSDLGHTSPVSLPTGAQSGGTPSGPVEIHPRLEDDEAQKSLVESIFVSPDSLSLIKDDTCSMSCPVVSPSQYSSEILASSDIGSQGEDEDPICPSMETDLNSGTKLPLDGEDFKSENDVIATQHSSEDLSSVVEAPVSSFTEELSSDFSHGKPQDEPDSAEASAEVLYSDQQLNFEEVPRVMLGDEIHGFTVADDSHIIHVSSPDYISQDNLVIVNDTSTETVHSDDQGSSALPLADSAENDASIFTLPASGFVSSPSRNLSDLHEAFSSGNSHETEIESNEAELTKISVGLKSEKMESKLESSSDVISFPMKRLAKLDESLSTFADSHEKGMEFNEVVAQRCLTELVTPKVVDQPELAFVDVRSNPCRSVPCDPSDSEICNDIQKEKIQYGSAVNDIKMVPIRSELDSQRSESVFLSQNDVQNSKDSLSSPSYNQLKRETHLEVGTNQLEQQSTSPATSEFAPEIHPDESSSFDSSSQLSFQETNCTKHVMDPLQPLLSDLFLGETNNHEEMPPMPPLPPMQWRVGKVQHASLVSQREEIEVSQASFQSIQPVKPDDKSQFGLSNSDRNTIMYQNPFFPVMAVGSNELLQSSGFLAGVSEHPVAIPLQYPIMVNESNGQYNYLVMKRSQNQNPFLTLPVVSTGSSPNGYVIASEEEMASPCPPIPPAECSFSAADPISPQEKMTESPSQLMENTSLVLPTECAVCVDDPISPKESPTPRQLMEETSLEVEKLEQSSTHLESEQGDPFVSPLSPPKIETVHPNESPLPSKGEMSLEISAQTPDFDSEVPNGKPKNKLPRARNPLIDDVAALDKSKLRKVSERVTQNPLVDAVAALDKSKLRKVSEWIRPQIAPKVDERDSLLEQIRTKSFNLRPAVATRPIIQGPKTNLRVAAILEKANSIRQALAGSDEDDADSWSDS